MQATTRTSRFGWRFAAVVGIATIVLGIGNAGATATRQPVPVPRLADVSAASQTPRLFTATGKDFTAGGRVYLAVYDQMGARLYETRWITASPAPVVVAGPTGHEAAGLHGGTLREVFADLCGATAMLRALDEATATWSNWLTVEPACDSGDGPNQTGRLDS